MKKLLLPLCVSVLTAAMLLGCERATTETEDVKAVSMQQKQYALAQPIPVYEWSLERHLLIELYNKRNERVATHSVWRSSLGTIEDDCPSLGYGLPYDTSLTNPLQATDVNGRGYGEESLTSIGQPEPNGVFASTNTSATWVFCVVDGQLAPIYVEAKVTAYPYPLTVDYNTNRVTRAGKATVTVRDQ